MRKTPRAATTPRPHIDNIATICKLEEQFLEDRTAVERLGDAIGSFVGSMTFVVLHLAIFTLWFLVNSKILPIAPAFDPFPFILLNMAVSLEAVLLSTFVLMKQNRESRRAEHRQHLTLQVDLLAEQEATKTLQLVQLIGERLGIKDIKNDAETNHLSANTALNEVADELKRKLPAD